MTQDKAMRLGDKRMRGPVRLTNEAIRAIQGGAKHPVIDRRGRLVGDGAATGGTDEGSRIAAELMREGVVAGDSKRYVADGPRLTVAQAQAKLADMEIALLEDRVAGATGQAKGRVSRADAFVLARVAAGDALWEAEQELHTHMELEAQRLRERRPELEHVAGTMVRRWFAAAA